MKCKAVGIGISSLVGNRETGGTGNYKGGIKGHPRNKKACVQKCWAGEI